MRLNPRLLLSALALSLSAGVAAPTARAQLINVDACAPPYNTLARAVAEAESGSTLVVRGGSYPQRLTIQKNLTITAPSGPVLVGEYFVGTREICVPVTMRQSEPDNFLVNCADTPGKVGVRAKLYYPSKAPGGAQIACGGPFPALIYAHGLCSRQRAEDDYRKTEEVLRHLATAGMIVITVDNSWGYDSVSTRGAVVINTIAYLRDENRRSGSRLEGGVDLRRVALSGHSLGAEAASHAALNLRTPPFDALGLSGVRIRALALLAPGGLSTVSPPEGLPVLTIAGTNDLQADLGQVVFRYESASRPKHLVVITGANHYGHTDDIESCGAGNENPGQVGGVTGPESRRRQQLAVRKYLNAFFSYYLRGDTTQLDYLRQQGETQCDAGDTATCGLPRRRFDDLDELNVEVNVCSCVR